MDTHIEITLVRHGEAEHNKIGINPLPMDYALTETGKWEAQRVAESLSEREYDIVFVSRLSRTKATLAPYLAVHPELKVFEDELLSERNMGELVGTPREMIVYKTEADMEEAVRWKPKSGESIMDVFKRAEKFMKKLRCEYTGKHVLVCGHQSFLRALEILITGRPLHNYYSDKLARLKNAEIRHFTLN